jgi:hypothetical protein
MTSKIAICTVTWAAFLSLFMVGCIETVSSENIKTQGIAAIIDVTATSSTKSKIKVKLLVGGDESNTYVDLSKNDRIYASADDDRKRMTETSAGEFEAIFEEGAEDTEFKVELERSEFDDAKGSVGTLPAPFDITTDLSTQSYSRANDDIAVEWEPSDSDDAMTLDVEEQLGEGGCFFDVTDEDIDGDPGTLKVRADTLDSTGSDPETCNAKITITRTRNGKTDSRFDAESRFRLHQVRTIKFASAP